MDTRTLVIAFISAFLAIFLSMLIMAIPRKNMGLNLYAAGVGSCLLGLICLAGQGFLSPWLSIILANFLLFMFDIFIVYGTRIYFKMANPFPKRFWFYIILYNLLFIADTFIFNTIVLRYFINPAYVSIIILEFYYCIKKNRDLLSKTVLFLSRFICFGYPIFQMGKILIVVTRPPNQPVMFESNSFLSFSMVGSLFFSILWVFLIYIMDSTILIREINDKNQMLKSLAQTDELTGLYNRNLLEQRLINDMEMSDRYHEPLSLIMMDLDHFKNVNDNWGHDTGDEVLATSANIIRNAIRKSDMAFRWGGEEFLILTPHTNLKGAESLAEKIREHIASGVYPKVGRITASFGVAEHFLTESSSQWFKRADLSLYKAKNSGRNCVVSWAESTLLPVAQVNIMWRQEWESGNKEIDAGHRMIVEMTNRLIESSFESPFDPSIKDRVASYMEHLEEHFAKEEKELEIIGFPEWKKHAEVHSALLQESSKLQEDYFKGELEQAAFFNFLLSKLVIGHILSQDVKFYPYTMGKRNAGKS